MIEPCCEYLSVPCVLLYVIIISHTRFRVNPHCIVCLNDEEILAPSSCYISSLSSRNEIPTHNHLIRKRKLDHLPKLAKWLSCLLSFYMYGAFIIMSRMSLRNNPLSIVCLNPKEPLPRSRRQIWSLNDSSKIRSHNYLVCKRTLNHVAKLAGWLSCFVSTYLYGAFDCVFLLCNVRDSEWIPTL